MTNNEGILGVLGGMGPQATNTFYQRIIDRTQAESDQEHLRVLIWSDAKIPDRTAGILGGREEEVFQHLLADAKLLEKAGCTHLAIPCNTSHYFADRLQAQLHIPIIHMIRETVKAIQAAGKLNVSTYMEYELKKLAMQQSLHTFLLADGSKFGRESLMAYGTIADLEEIITDGNCPDFARQLCAQAGVRLTVVDE